MEEPKRLARASFEVIAAKKAKLRTTTVTYLRCLL
jgi:hypothetical protein